jgi:EmrB/QacA subfamily drug resistance transporter
MQFPQSRTSYIPRSTGVSCGGTGIRSMSHFQWTLIAAILGSSMAFADGTVVNVALPAIQADLGADASQAQWVIESYALFLASLLLVGGALGDRFGRRRIFMLGVAVFTLSAIACALARGPYALIAARAVQGIGAALLVPGSLALISATFPQAQRGKAIGTWSGFSGVAAAIGPVLGGFLVDHFSWRWAFVINVPIAAVLLAICLAKVPESHGQRATGSGLDAPGAVLATLGLAGVVFALIEAPVQGWTAVAVITAAVAGAVGLVLFVSVQARSRSPMLPLRLFRNRNFTGANLLTLFLYAALGGGMYFFPLNLIQVQGLGATAAGAALLPFVAIMLALSRWAGKLVDRTGPRIPLVAGPLVAAAGFALFAWPAIGGSYWSTFFPATCVLGLGMTLTIAPLTTTVMNSIGAELAGTASGVNNAVSRAAGLLAIAAMGLVMTAMFDPALETRLGALQVPAAAKDSVRQQEHKLAAIGLPAGLDAKSAAAVKHAVGESFVAGFRAVMLTSAALAVLSALAAWLLIEGKPASKRAKGQGAGSAAQDPR